MLGATGYGEELKAEQKKGQAAAHDEHHPIAKALKEGKVAGCESMQEIAATIALSCTVNLNNIKAAKLKSQIWVL